MTQRPPIKQVEVQIMGQLYTLACPAGGEDALREAVTQVDAAMCRIRDAGKVKARERIAVLAALNIAYDAAHRDPALAFRNSSFGAAEGEHAHAESLAPDAERRLRELVNRIDAALADDRLL